MDFWTLDLGLTILHAIGRYSKLADLDKVRACLREGADINWTNPDSKTQTHPGGETCLMWAVRGDWQNPRKYQVIEFLLSQPRLEVNKQDYSGAPALVCAMDAADSQAARLILAHPGADPTIRTWAGQ